MAKRKNLRNPDILPFDYVSVLLNWTTTSPLTATPTFRVSKVLKGTFPFDATMLSFTAVDSSSSISFTFQSPFDINTSPWQFELELAFTTTVSKFRPTAVYNGSNNQITVKFNVGNLVINTAYPVVFTAKRYRPTTQYLAQLAAASQNPVSINSTGSINSTFFFNTSGTSGTTASEVPGFIFQAPSNFVITTAGFPFFAANSTFYLRIIKFTTMPTNNVSTSNFTNLFNSNSTSSNLLSANVNVNTGDIIAIFSSRFQFSTFSYSFPTFLGTPYTVNINGTIVPIEYLGGSVGSQIDTFTNITRQASTSFLPFPSTVNFTSAGGTAWSNILY